MFILVTKLNVWFRFYIILFFQVKSGKSAVVYMPIVATVIGEINVTVMAKSQLAKEIATKTLIVEVS